MALKAVSKVELKEQVLKEREQTRETVAEICARWKISPASFYRWKARYEARGAEGLGDLPRRPFRSRGQIPFDLEDQICRMRKDHPRWGARRIRAELIRAGISPPAVSTVHQALRRNHLVADQPRKRPKAKKRFTREVPNDLWQIDATRVKLATGAPAWVIDVLDDNARYLVAAVACWAPTTEAACQAFSEGVSRCGLPRQVLSDNGSEFTGRLPVHEVAFELQLKAAGVQLIHSRPYHPETIGKIERFHQTLKAWLADHGPPRTLEKLQALLDRFREHYNSERLHQALGEATVPAERYLPSPQPLHELVEEDPVYPAGAVIRTVGRNGSLTFSDAKINVGVRWAGRRLRIVDRSPRLDVFYGSELVRSVALEPGRSYYPVPSRRFPGRRSRH
jgi:transposase InsO family protein